MRSYTDLGGSAKLSNLRRGILLFVLVSLLAGVHGCTRGYFRKSADDEVNDILTEKNRYPEWGIEQWHVYADPRARFADPSNPDCPPMPPDDEAAWKLSPHPQQPGCAGVATVENTAYLEMMRTWDEQNRAERAAAASMGQIAPGQPEPINVPAIRSGPIQNLFDGPVAQQQGFLINMDQAVEMGVINSREYQNFREDLYLVALPVTLQRFSFAWQWAATEDAVRQWAGPNTPFVGYQNNWNLGSTVSVSKMFSTGALLTTAFANKTVFNFTNSSVKGLTSTSSINLDFVQPLLQGGGKAVTLEPLTQSERNLFYSIRAYARFREQFYSSIAFAGSLPSALALAAGTAGGTAGSPISTLAALGIASTDVAGQFRGYLPTLYRALDMAIDQKYVQDLEKALKLYEGFQEGGQVAPLQVDQVRSTLLNARNSVLKDYQDANNASDQLKLQLGLPANIPLVLDDAPARPITRQLDRYYELVDEANATQQLIERQSTLPPEKLRAFLLNVYTTDTLVRGTAFQQKLPGAWQAWQKTNDKDLKTRLEQLKTERHKLLDAKTDLELKKSALEAKGLAFGSADQQMLDTVTATLGAKEFESDVGELEQVLRDYEKQPWAKAAKEDQARQQIKMFRLVSYAAEIVLVWARNDRLNQVGQLWPSLPSAPLGEIDMLTAQINRAEEAAVQVALVSRWDLMNARAEVVDAWRQLAVRANALLGVLNVQYHLDTTTPPGGTKPITFSAAATNQELIINAQLPLVRVAERNAYKAAQIAYERARRNLIGLEDTVAAQVRFDVRQLQLFAENFRIQVKVVASLYSQVENSLEVIVAPVDPDQLKASGTSGAANAAALTQQYLNALSGLNNAQTKMYDIWLSYLATRMQLYLDLERLPLDMRGVWIDESATNRKTLPSVNRNGPVPQNLPDNVRGSNSGIIVIPAAEWGTGPSSPSQPVRLLPPAAPSTVE